MNWRTDKPTADVIVAYSRYVFEQIVEYGFDVLNKFNGEYYHDGELVPSDNIIKWADLEEEEIVTDCNELEKEIEKYCRIYYNCNYPDQIQNGKCSPVMPHIVEAARHFAKWGAEHLKK